MASERRRSLETAIDEARQELAEARAESAEMAESSRTMKMRIEELEGQLAEQNRGLAGLDLGAIDEPLVVLDQQLRESIGREQFLARRVAEMEAQRVRRLEEGAEDPADDAGARLRDMTERVEALRLQLDATRARDDELTAKTVHADTVLTDVGSRLAELGEAAERVESLDIELAEARANSAETEAALEQARTDVATLEARVNDLEGTASDAADLVDAATTRARTAEQRVEEMDDTLAVTTLERDGARSELMRLMEEEQTRTAQINSLELEVGRAVSEGEAALVEARQETASVRQELQTARAGLEGELARAQATIDDAAEARAVQEREIAELREAVEAAAFERGQFEAATASLNDRIEELMEGHREATVVLTAAQEELASAHARVQELEPLLEATDERIMNAEVLAADAEMRAAASEERLASLGSSQEAAEASARSAEARAETFEAQLIAVQRELEDVREQLGELEPARLAAEERAESAGAALAQAETRLQDAAEHAARLDDELAQAGVRVTELQITVSAAEARATSAEEATAQANAAAEERGQATVDEAVERANDRAGEVHSQLETLREELASVRASLEETTTAHAASEERAEALRIQHEDALARIDALSQELEGASGGDEIGAAKQDAERRVADLERELAEVRAATTEMGSAADQAQARVRDADQAVSDAQARAAEVEARALDAESRVQALEAELVEARMASESAPLNEVSAVDQGADREALARAEARIADLERDLMEAVASPVTTLTGEAIADGDQAAIIADLESRLEQTEVRARRAYAAAESAEAALRFAKERGEVIASDPAMEQEVVRLREKLGKAMEQATGAEEARKRAEADSAALRAGVEPNALADPLEQVPPQSVEDNAYGSKPEAESAEAPEPVDRPDDVDAASGRSLRSRLAATALNKKPRPVATPSSADEWR